MLDHVFITLEDHIAVAGIEIGHFVEVIIRILMLHKINTESWSIIKLKIGWILSGCKQRIEYTFPVGWPRFCFGHIIWWIEARHCTFTSKNNIMSLQCYVFYKHSKGKWNLLRGREKLYIFCWYKFNSIAVFDKHHPSTIKHCSK